MALVFRLPFAAQPSSNHHTPCNTIPPQSPAHSTSPRSLTPATCLRNTTPYTAAFFAHNNCPAVSTSCQFSGCPTGGKCTINRPPSTCQPTIRANRRSRLNDTPLRTSGRLSSRHHRHTECGFNPVINTTPIGCTTRNNSANANNNGASSSGKCGATTQSNTSSRQGNRPVEATTSAGNASHCNTPSKQPESDLTPSIANRPPSPKHNTSRHTRSPKAAWKKPHSCCHTNRPKSSSANQAHKFRQFIILAP